MFSFVQKRAGKNKTLHTIFKRLKSELESSVAIYKLARLFELQKRKPSCWKAFLGY
tara:strand:+ start:61150 stop:61317 length:168 start_codon:yes stop_codon:yes gene_type:complete